MTGANRAFIEIRDNGNSLMSDTRNAGTHGGIRNSQPSTPDHEHKRISRWETACLINRILNVEQRLSFPVRFVVAEVSGAARAGMPPIHPFRTSKYVALGESRLWLESTTNILASILRFYFNEP